VATVDEQTPDQRRAELEQAYGPVYNTDELIASFTVLGFMAPFVAVTRKADGVKGSLQFIHRPRFYFGFVPHERG
jgi:hypothetical protein